MASTDIHTIPLGPQFGALEGILRGTLARDLREGLPGFLEVVGKDMEVSHLDRIDRERDPDGGQWARISPLTLALRAATGGGGSRLGGRKLRASFRRGRPGNVFNIQRASNTLTYGSKLTRNGVRVVASFQSTFTMPKLGNLTAEVQGRGRQKRVVSSSSASTE